MLDMATETEDPKSQKLCQAKICSFFWTFKVLMPIVTSDEMM